MADNAQDQSPKAAGKTAESTTPATQDRAPAAAAAADTPASGATKLQPAAWLDRARSVFDVSPIALAGALSQTDPNAPLEEGAVRELVAQFEERPGIAEESA